MNSYFALTALSMAYIRSLVFSHPITLAIGLTPCVCVTVLFIRSAFILCFY